MQARGRASAGFTLIEVMVAVIIVAVVIGAMLRLFATNTHLLGGIEPRFDAALQGTLLLGIGDTGFEKHDDTLYSLVETFNVDDDLRRRLKAVTLTLRYEELQRFDSASFATPTATAGSAEETEASFETKDAETGDVALEIGATTAVIGGESLRLIRMRLQ